MYDHILVPTDGSDDALAAARRAVDLATHYEATVHALYVIDTDTGWLTVSKSDVRDSLRAVGKDAGHQALTDIEELTDDVDLVTELREGSPDDVILDYVTEAGIDLVVMGTRGRDGLRRRLTGSIVDRIVHDATVPVMTVTASTDTDHETKSN